METMEDLEEVQEMSKQRLGSCNRCGKCCRELVTSPHMLDPETGICKYYSEEVLLGQRVGVCELKFFTKPLKKRPEGVPERDWLYFLNECVPYPEAQYTVDKGDDLPEGCGYSWEEV